MIRLGAALLAACALAVTAACSSTDATPSAPATDAGTTVAEGPATPDTTDLATDLRAPCEAPRVYLVAIRGRVYDEPVRGTGGEWKPRPAFPGASGDVLRFATALRWSSPTGAAPDGEALLRSTSSGSESKVVPLCGEGASVTVVPATAVEVPWAEKGVGAVPCEVCALVSGKLYAVVPPDRVQPEVQIRRGSGDPRAFRLETGGARLVVVDLPPEPSLWFGGFAPMY